MIVRVNECDYLNTDNNCASMNLENSYPNMNSHIKTYNYIGDGLQEREILVDFHSDIYFVKGLLPWRGESL